MSLLSCQQPSQVSLFSNGGVLVLERSSSAICIMFNLLLTKTGAGTILHVQLAPGGNHDFLYDARPPAKIWAFL